MKVIVTIKDGNKSADNFTKEIDMSPQEYDQLKEISRSIYGQTGQYYVTAFVHKI